MFDILSNIFKNPGTAFSPLPFWFWNDELEEEEITRQIDDFHKKGVDGFVIHPRMGMQVEGGYLSDSYFKMVETALAAARKRRMLVVLYDEAMYPSGSAHGLVAKQNPLMAARCLYARPTGSYTLAEGEDAQMRMALQFNKDGKLTDVLTDVEEVPEDYTWYDFILGFTGGTIRGISPDEEDGKPNAPMASDLLNEEATDSFISCTHEAYYSRFSEDFGKTIIGFFTDEPSLSGRCADMNGRISWTYDFHEAFGEEGGNALMLASLLFPTADKRIAKDAEYIYNMALKRRLAVSYYGKLSQWCEKHGIALMGHPASSHDMGLAATFDVPGQDLVWRMVTPEDALTSMDSVLAKCSADAARHKGISRNSCECFGACGKQDNPWDFTAAEMMWQLNFLFARGVNMIIPHAFYYSLRTELQSNERPPDVGPGNIWWSEYRPLANYIKRMSWLNATNHNNPQYLVVAMEDNLPVHSVKYLYENGYTFNYVTIEQLINDAHIHDGIIRLDRYQYDTVLIDSRIRLTVEAVKKIGEFVTGGGKMYRGNDFGEYVKKHGKKTSYFDAQNPNIRFVHLTKSGYPFFLLFNEGEEAVSGHLITDKSGACRRFDPFTGKTETVYAEMHTDGLSYPVTVEPWSVVILGLNVDVLPELGENPVDTIREIVALGENRQTFTCSLTEDTVCLLKFAGVHDRCDVNVNGEKAGVVLYKPYTLDITKFCHDGENTVEWTVTGSAANKYGNPIPTSVEGARVEIYTRK